MIARFRKSSHWWSVPAVPVLAVLSCVALTNGRTTYANDQTPFQRSLAEYTALAAELDADLAACRASTPLLVKFSDVYTKTISPLILQRHRAKFWLLDAKKRGVRDLSGYNWTFAKVQLALI